MQLQVRVPGWFREVREFQFGLRVTSGSFQDSGLVPSWFQEVREVPEVRWQVSGGSSLVLVDPPRVCPLLPAGFVSTKKKTFPGPESYSFSVLGSSHAPVMLR